MVVSLNVPLCSCDRGTSTYAKARLPGREDFASRLEVGRFFMCSVTDIAHNEIHEEVVILKQISVNDDGECVIGVSVL